MKHIIVFLRHVNDLDHLTPVIWKWLQENKNSATVVFPWGCPVAKSDFRIGLLRSNNCRIIFLDPDTSRSWRDIEIQDFVGSLWPTTAKSCIVFDWVHQGMHEEIRWAQALIPWAHRRQVPVVCLPHGDHCHAGVMLRTAEINHEHADIYAPISMFDALVVPSAHCGKRYSKHLPEARIFTLGSPRFNAEWLAVLDKITPDLDIPNSESRCKIALFLRSTQYPIFWEEVLWTIKLIKQFPNLHLVIVPHTRSQGWNSLIQAYPEIQETIENLTFLNEDVFSGTVVKWADVVIDIGTSMAFEAVIRGKSILCPEYLHATRTVTSKYFPQAVALCRDELYDLMSALHKNPNCRWHSTDEAEIFIQNLIHVPDLHVLKRYADFLENFIEAPRTQNIEEIYPAPEMKKTKHHLSLVDKYAGLSKNISQRDQIIAEIIAAHLRMRWAQLLQCEQIHTVFLFGEKNQIHQFFGIIKDTKGPAIRGLLSSEGEQDETVNGFPFLPIELENTAEADAVVMADEFNPECLRQRYLSQLPQKTKIIRLYETAHTSHYMRLKRDTYLADENYSMALGPALALLEISHDESDLRQCYQIGIALQKLNCLEKAQIVYEMIAAAPEVKPELTAWALFKQGEIYLDQGKSRLAREYFSRSLLHNPRHSKAAIFLTPADRPLRVKIMERTEEQGCENDSCIEVIMNISDPELWKYYFARRKPDFVLLIIGKSKNRQKLTASAGLLWSYLAPAGTAEIIFSNEQQHASLHQAEEIFRSAGFRLGQRQPPDFQVVAQQTVLLKGQHETSRNNRVISP